jgi:selenocysteine lyase/cysteine desulfurase
MNLNEFRATIPSVNDVTYLNTGSSSPNSVDVVESMQDFLEYHGYESPTGPGMYSPVYEVFEKTRKDVATFLNARPEEVALTQSTGDGISRVANAIQWNDGDTVVRTDLAHPSFAVPWSALERDFGINTTVVETTDGHVDLDDVKDAVADARLVCLSSVTRNYGTRLPVEMITEIAHDAEAEVLVDAVQSVGQVPVDVTDWGADYVAGASHKWLVGPWGAGFLYASEDVVSDLRPRHRSYRGVDRDSEEFALHPDARRLEVGTRSAAPYVGLRTALDRVSSIGMETIESRIESLTTLLKDELPASALLSPRTFESGLVAVDDDTPGRTVERLANHDVQVRSISEPDAIRLSIHAFNTESDIRRFLSVYDDSGGSP